MGRTCIDMTGKQIHWLTIIEKVVEDKPTPGGAKWLCECKCGNKKIIRGGDLRSGRVHSCGCYNSYINKKIHQYENLLNKKFGKLLVIEDTFKSSNNRHHLWKCKCECGNTCIVSADNLKSNNTLSCGCLSSKGEQKIMKILQNANIHFEKEKIFQNCIFPDSKGYARFDFFVNNKYIIEYDGIQHFESKGGWNTEDTFIKTKQHDEYKNNWCKENNIPLIRIPYYKLDSLTLDDLLLKEDNN